MANPQRTSFIVRCPSQDAAAIRTAAKAQHRSVSGCLLYILERSLWIEEKFAAALVRSTPRLSGTTTNFTFGEVKAVIHLCCSVAELDRIQAAASRRRMSVNAFIMFSVRRYWRAIENVQAGMAPKAEVSGEPGPVTEDQTKPDREP